VTGDTASCCDFTSLSAFPEHFACIRSAFPLLILVAFFLNHKLARVLLDQECFALLPLTCQVLHLWQTKGNYALSDDLDNYLRG
jgi:hypothetical protein